MHDCTSEHEQGFAEGVRVSWHHTQAVFHGFHVTVLVKTCCCSSTIGHPWGAVGCRELGTPTLVCHLTWSVGEVFGNGWLGSQGLRLNVYISYYHSTTSLKLFFPASFFLGDKSSHPQSKAGLFAHKVWGDPRVTPRLSRKELLFLVLHCALWSCLLPK